MIPLEKQQVNLELSKELKEAGYIQEGLWWWCSRTYPQIGLEFKLYDSGEAENWVDGDVFVAPTVAELLRAFPKNKSLYFYENYDDGAYGRYEKPVFVGYQTMYIPNQKPKHREFGDTLQEALVKMWLHLKKEGLLK